MPLSPQAIPPASGSPIPHHHGPDALDWGLLRAFVAVMRVGSLSAAAVQMGVTQPTVGRQIRALEQQVGESLFDRVPQGLKPTARAMALFDYANALEQAAAALAGAIAERPEALSGPVRVTASESFGVQVLPPLLRDLAEANPGLELEFSLSNKVQNLLRRDADIAIRYLRPEQPDLIARRVGRMELGLFAHPDYVAAKGMPETLNDLLSHRLIGPDKDEYGFRLFSNRGLNVRPQDLALRTDSLMAQEAAVRAGFGVGVMQMAGALKGERLVRLLPEAFAPSLSVWIVGHPGVHQPGRFRTAYTFLSNTLQKELLRIHAEAVKVFGPSEATTFGG
ncbi:LysR family transcriptional regulator [Acetobacteraceae bacterium H6797]|nr:LysR family transcriptional regulator [Acetobacteraceae bacterium H6797]